MRILGIETSCDDTAAAVVEVTEERKNQRTKEFHGSCVHEFLRFSVLSNVAASQTKAHNKTGGVVPEVAARAHQQVVLSVLEEALQPLNPKFEVRNSKQIRNSKLGNLKIVSDFDIRYSNLLSTVDAIAVTYGPGLLTSLMVGAETAKTLSYITGKPLIGVNHMAGHIYANWLPPVGEILNSKSEILNKSQTQNSKNSLEFRNSSLEFPAIILLVSGGHTELVLMRGHLDFEVIGQTRDDAAGECFDKVAKMLNLGYPGGPAVARIADKFKVTQSVIPAKAGIQVNSGLDSRLRGNDKNATPYNLSLPRPMLDSNDYDFSFSGLKTAVTYFLRDRIHPSPFSSPPSGEELQKKYSLSLEGRGQGEGEFIAALCHEVQNAIIEVLVAKTVRAAKDYHVKTVMLGGGVAANNHLRQELGEALSSYLPSITYTLVPKPYTTDNAAMIAAAGYFYAKANKFVSWKDLRVDAKAAL